MRFSIWAMKKLINYYKYLSKSMSSRLINFIKQTIIRIFNKLKTPGKISKILTGPLHGYKWDYFSAAPAYYFGSFERKKVNLFIKEIAGAKVVIDLGANVGYYSLIAGKCCPNAKVYAVEPSRRNIIFLEKHITLNKFSNIEIVKKRLAIKTA